MTMVQVVVNQETGSDFWERVLAWRMLILHVLLGLNITAPTSLK